MASTTPASIIPLHQPARPKTAAERQRAYRERKAAAKAAASAAPVAAPPAQPDTPGTPAPPAATPVTPVTVTPRVTPGTLLTVAAFGLAAVGVIMNGWFAHSLGSSDIAGWLFLAIGVASDLVALATPARAATLWHARQRGAALAGWAIWLATFAFAITAAIGFVAVNVADVTASRASRVTPAVTASRAALADAMAARDRECAGGVGKNCRLREESVIERRRALEQAMHAVEQTADPQTEAATRIVTWLTRGMLAPTGDDFAMVRLILLAFLLQVRGILLMVARNAAG